MIFLLTLVLFELFVVCFYRMKLHRFFSFFFLLRGHQFSKNPEWKQNPFHTDASDPSRLAGVQHHSCPLNSSSLAGTHWIIWRRLEKSCGGKVSPSHLWAACKLWPQHTETHLTPSEHQGCRHVNVLVVWKYCRWSTIMMLPNKSSVWGCWISTTGAQSGTNVTTMQSVLSGDVCWIWSSFDTFSCCYFELVLTTYLIHMAWNVYMMVHMCSFFDGGVRI